MKPFATYFPQVFIMFQHCSEHILLKGRDCLINNGQGWLSSIKKKIKNINVKYYLYSIFSQYNWGKKHPG